MGRKDFRFCRKDLKNVNEFESKNVRARGAFNYLQFNPIIHA